MEALLQEYHDEGMRGLSFLIVNARDPLSQGRIDQLKKRVSFPVYQDNPYDDVWNILQGGKDDMYIYDRCGRLTFYLPFPLSFIHPQQPLVNEAVRATYFYELCGDSCLTPEENNSITSNNEESFDHLGGNDTYGLDIPQAFSGHANHHHEVEDIKDVFGGNMSTNGSEILINDGDEFMFLLNSTVLVNETDLDAFNDTAYSNITNKLVLNNETELPGNLTELLDMIVTAILNGTDISENTIVEPNNGADGTDISENTIVEPSNNSDEFFHNKALNKSEHVDNKKAGRGRCVDPSHEQMCLSWTKRKLKKVKRCCMLHHQTRRHKSHCKDYSKSKCKKLHPILKCCLGTADDVVTETSIVDAVTTTQDYFATTE